MWTDFYFRNFVEEAKDLYFDGAIRFETMCEDEIKNSNVDKSTEDLFQNILDRVQKMFKEKVYKEDDDYAN